MTILKHVNNKRIKTKNKLTTRGLRLLKGNLWTDYLCILIWRNVKNEYCYSVGIYLHHVFNTMIGYVEQCVTFVLFYRRLPYMGMVPL